VELHLQGVMAAVDTGSCNRNARLHTFREEVEVSDAVADLVQTLVQDRAQAAKVEAPKRA
jgi:hypothetical protein